MINKTPQKTIDRFQFFSKSEKDFFPLKMTKKFELKETTEQPIDVLTYLLEKRPENFQPTGSSSVAKMKNSLKASKLLEPSTLSKLNTV